MTNKLQLSFASLFTALVLIAFAAPAGAQTEILVAESTAPGIAAGARLGMDASVEIPGGGHIRVVLPSGKTQTIRGPFSGKVADLAKGAAPNAGLWAMVTDMLKTGGSTEKTMGATRSVSRPTGKPRGFSWVELPTAAEGNICLQKGASVLLTRVSTTRRDRVTLIDMSGGQRGEAVWEQGSQTATWPSEVTLRAGGTYQMMVQDMPMRQVTVRIVDKLPEDDDVLTALYEQGCQQQMATWLRERKQASTQ